MHAKLGFREIPVSRSLKQKLSATLSSSQSASPIAWTMSLNLQLFLLLLITTLRYGFLGFTLSMFLDILIIIFLYSSLHNRRFMSQARRTRHFERSAKRAQSARRREEKNRAPVTSPFFWLFRPPMLTSIDYRRWCLKGPTKPRSVTQKFSPFWLPETPTAA